MVSLDRYREQQGVLFFGRKDIIAYMFHYHPEHIFKIFSLENVPVGSHAGQLKIVSDTSQQLLTELQDSNTIKYLDDHLIARGYEVFGEYDSFYRRLTSKNEALGGQIPLILLNDSDGQERILDILGRIEHGVYS